jgi:c-di-GMP-binding flagellar brake protein YcgR
VRGPFQNAITLDISGGGLCVPWGEPIAKGAELELELDLEKEPVRALARVVELRPNPDPPPSFHLALQFVRITDADRSRIVRFVFAKQWASRER